MPLLETGVAATEVTLAAAHHRRSLVPALRRLRYRISHGHFRIAVLGPAGAGKTTLGRFLSGELAGSGGDPLYKESYDMERFRLKGDAVCSLLVAPGQKRRIQGREDLYQRLMKGKAAAIVNVVSYGYESLGALSFKQTTLYQTLSATAGHPLTLEDFLPYYFAERRQEEQAYLEAVIPSLEQAKRKVWMITLVTKEDLWWDQRDAVHAHYEQGTYNKTIEAVVNVRKTLPLQHEYLYASLVISRMITEQNDVFAENVAGYDQHIQYAHQERLLTALLALVDS